MKIIRGASGFGDSMYLIPVIKYLKSKGEDIAVSSHWGEVYKNVCQTIAYDRYMNVNYDATYVTKRSNKTTNQYEDVCDSVIPERPPFDHSFVFGEERHISNVKIDGRPIILIRMPYYREGKGQLKNEDLVPSPQIMQMIVDKYKKDYQIINIGNGIDKVVSIDGVYDTSGKTNLTDVLWLANKAECCITQCGMLLPIAEIQNKRVFVIFPKDYTNSEKFLVQTATPEKVITKGSTQYIYGDDVDHALDRFQMYLENKPYKNQATKLHVDNMIRGKRVVVFGSAPSAIKNNGDEIMKYDTIVRVNGTDNDTVQYGDKIGTRTDIHYSFYGTSVKRTPEGLKRECVKLLYSKIPYANYTKYYKFDEGERQGFLNFNKYFDNFRFAGVAPLFLPTIRDLNKECKIVNRMLTSGVSAIRNILSHSPKELYITGFDFFESGLHNINIPWRNGDGGHKTKSEKEYVKSLVESNSCIKIDDRLKEVFRG